MIGKLHMIRPLSRRLRVVGRMVPSGWKY